MQDELIDSEIVRLIAYVKPISLPEDFDIDNLEEIDLSELGLDDQATMSEEYLIDFLTVKEAKTIGSKGILEQVAGVLIKEKVIKENDSSSLTWRLLRDGDLTPIEIESKKVSKNLNLEKEIYKIKDLRQLH